MASDFITKLPMTTRGYDAITTFVDRFSKHVHFIFSQGVDTAPDAAKAFYECVFRQHGLPDSIVSDRDPKFKFKFWQELLGLCDVQLAMYTSHHPQTDGASEVMNRMIENYLRCYCGLQQDDWDLRLIAAEFAYNSASIKALGMSPFECDLGWLPKSPLDCLVGKQSRVESVDEFRSRMASAYEDAKFAQHLASARSAAYNSKKRTPVSYAVGDEVWLSRKYFTDSVSKDQTSRKLGVKRYGPFKVIALVGKNAVKLKLPSQVKVHPFVHVEHTKRVHKQPQDICSKTAVVKPVTGAHGKQEYEVERIMAHRKRRSVYQWLTVILGEPQHEATWKPTKDFIDDDGTVTKALKDYVLAHGLDNALLTRSSTRRRRQR